MSTNIASEPDEPDKLRLNERIAAALREDIARQVYPVGSVLPTEAALCRRFGASRYTVREALRKLVAAGLIERQQGAGSRVIAGSPPKTFSHTFADLAEIFQYAKDTRFDVAQVRLVRITAEEASLVGAPANSHWLRISGVRRTADLDTVISHVTVYVHARFAPLLKDVRSASVAIYALVEARSGEMIAEAIQEIAALPAPADVARAIGIQRGRSSMRFVRRYIDYSGGTMLTSINWHAGDRFTYTMHLRRGDWSL